jgi:hypothetical protein
MDSIGAADHHRVAGGKAPAISPIISPQWCFPVPISVFVPR